MKSKTIIMAVVTAVMFIGQGYVIYDIHQRIAANAAALERLEKTPAIHIPIPYYQHGGVDAGAK